MLKMWDQRCHPLFEVYQYSDYWGPGRGVPVSKINVANIPIIQKALYPHIPKIDPSIPYPFKYLQKYPVSL